MLYYPKIPGSRNCPDGRCIAFEKYDGTNLHWTWDAAKPGRGEWATFGTRRDDFPLDLPGVAAFEAAHAEMAGVCELFRATPAAVLSRIIQLRYSAALRVICFTEYVGPGSFAGLHKAGEPKRLVLLDVEVDGRMISRTSS